MDEEFRRLMLWLEAQARLEKLRGKSRAQIDALFRMLDRLDGGGGAAPA